jgi:hypothetical protein
VFRKKSSTSCTHLVQALVLVLELVLERLVVLVLAIYIQGNLHQRLTQQINFRET